MKNDILLPEINLINTIYIKEWTIKTLENTPDYFFKAPASSTGKFHPQCTCKEGGLIIHVKRAVYIANRLCSGWGIKDLDRDIVISATILHDIAKVGNPAVAKTTYEDYENHPINGAELINSTLTLAENSPPFNEIVRNIMDCVKYHMGLWTPEKVRKEIKDYTLLELVVYTADYIATTKDLITPKDNG
jgi:HD superfamily phosphohydrolase YqeK